MGVQVSQNGWIRLQVTNNTPRFFNLLRRNENTVMHKVGEFIKNKMDIYVAVDTGYLKSRNFYRVDMNNRVMTGNNSHYAAAQEFGRRDLPNYRFTPFIRPAVYNHVDEIKQIGGRWLSNGIN